ncbi:MAG: ribosome maturation factor RimM [Actinomycetota bacterium]
MVDERDGSLIVGEIGKPHGIAGDVYVVRISDDPHRYDPGARLLHADGSTLVVERARTHRDRFLVKFEGIDSREDAERIRGTLYVDATAARELDDDEFWGRDVIGSEVFVGGERVGEVTALIPGAAQDLLEVDTPRGSRLVPFVKEIVVEVDPTQRRVTIDPPEGLLD